MVRDNHYSSFRAPISPKRKQEEEDWCLRTPETFLQQMLKRSSYFWLKKKKNRFSKGVEGA